MSKALRSFAFLLVVAALSAAAAAPGYSQNGDMKSKMMDTGKQMMCPAPTSSTSACALRKTLNLLLAEHVYLGAMATNAALKRQPEGVRGSGGGARPQFPGPRGG